MSSRIPAGQELLPNVDNAFKAGLTGSESHAAAHWSLQGSAHYKLGEGVRSVPFETTEHRAHLVNLLVEVQAAEKKPTTAA